MAKRPYQDLTPAQRAEERGKRIHRELESLGWTIRRLHEEVSEALGEGGRGAKYGSIRNYVKGIPKSHPRVEVVREIARALGVNYLYLMELEGPRSPEDAASDSEWFNAHDELKSEAMGLRIAAARQAVLPFDSDLMLWEMDNVLMFAAFDLLLVDGAKLDDYSPDEVKEAVELIAWLWDLPLRTAGVRFSTRAPLRRYWLAIAAAWSQATAARPSGGVAGTDRRSFGDEEGPRRALTFLRRLRSLEHRHEGEYPNHWLTAEDGSMWAGPYCASDKHRDRASPLAMKLSVRGDERYFVCPECHKEVRSQPPTFKRKKR